MVQFFQAKELNPLGVRSSKFLQSKQMVILKHYIFHPGMYMNCKQQTTIYLPVDLWTSFKRNKKVREMFTFHFFRQGICVQSSPSVLEPAESGKPSEWILRTHRLGNKD